MRAVALIAMVLTGCQILDQTPAGATTDVCPAVSGPWKVVIGTCFPKGAWGELSQDGCAFTGAVEGFTKEAQGTVSRDAMAFTLEGINTAFDCSLAFVEGSLYAKAEGSCAVEGWETDKCTLTLENTDPPEQPAALDPAKQPYTAGNDPGTCTQMCQVLAAYCPQTLTAGMEGCVANCLKSAAKVTLNDVGCLQSLGSCQDPLHLCDAPCAYDCKCESGNRVQQAQYFPIHGGCPPQDGYCPTLCGDVVQ
ncbi:MAG: hypothetical protein AMXMBFR64_50650 [Myxococcales bacterium]